MQNSHSHQSLTIEIDQKFNITCASATSIPWLPYFSPLPLWNRCRQSILSSHPHWRTPRAESSRHSCAASHLSFCRSASSLELPLCRHSIVRGSQPHGRQLVLSDEHLDNDSVRCGSNETWSRKEGIDRSDCRAPAHSLSCIQSIVLRSQPQGRRWIVSSEFSSPDSTSPAVSASSWL